MPSIGVACGVGYVVEYRGQAIDALSMEERMTICNMSIEFGSKMGIMNPDQTTYDYLKGRECVQRIRRGYGGLETIVSDDDAVYDKVLQMDVSDLAPMVTWGTNPAMGVDFDSRFPEIKDMNDERAYNYMDLEPGQKPADIELGYILSVLVPMLGSATCNWLLDLSKERKLLPT